jgi:xylulokinase
MAYLMGIDLGTSSLKVLILDTGGTIKAESSRDYQFDSPYNGYAEQDPEVWWTACRDCIREALSVLDAPAAEIKALGFSGQMHGLVGLDKENHVIRPVILHCDARSGEQVQKINAILDEKKLRNSQYNAVCTGFLLTSLLWLRENEPGNYLRINTVMLPKDFLKMKLCGEISTDYSDASGTLAFDAEKLCWSSELLDALDIPLSFFPPCFASDYPVGRVTQLAAVETGLSEGTLVVNGGADQVMQMAGNGAIQNGQATVNIGTSGMVCFQTNRPIHNPAFSTNLFCAHQKGNWLLMGAMRSAGLSFKWISGVLSNTKDYRKLDSEIAKAAPGSGGLLFLPYLNGERCPYMDSNLSGAFLGLNLNSGKVHLARAVMEGVTYSIAQCIEVCRGLGLGFDILIASGGGARSALWLQMQADIYNVPIKTTILEEQACVGAAAVAGSGAGLFKTTGEACDTLVKYKDKIWVPDSSRNRIYQEYYGVFKEAFTGSGKTLARLTELGRKRGDTA